MKFKKNRIFSVVVLVIAIMLFITSCGNTTSSNGKVKSCNHLWSNATCIAPKTCDICGKTEGSASLSHAYEGDKCKDCGLIKLTLDNYKDYLDCNATVRVGDSYYDSTYGYIYTSAECAFEAIGNTHYKYNNVSIVIRFCHYDKDGYMQYLLNSLGASIGEGTDSTEEAVPYDDATYTVNLNLAGNGSRTCELSTPWAKEKSKYSDTKPIFDRTMYEVVSISGTVQEY